MENEGPSKKEVGGVRKSWGKANKEYRIKIESLTSGGLCLTKYQTRFRHHPDEGTMRKVNYLP